MNLIYILKEYWRYCRKTKKWWFLLFIFFLAVLIPLIIYFQSNISLTSIYALF